MEIGRVIGSVWATKKDINLNGQKLLLIKIQDTQGNDSENMVVAADIVGAGVDETVLISYGEAARIGIGNSQAPVDAAVVGIVDSIEQRG